MRAHAVGLVVALAIVGCGADDEQNAAPATKTATRTTTTKAKPAKTKTKAPERPPPLPSGASGQAAEGRKLVIATGCLACHQIGGKGASEPGNNLDGIGSRRSHDELRQALVTPRAQMPSYDVLTDGKLAQLVAYLSSLRGPAG